MAWIFSWMFFFVGTIRSMNSLTRRIPHGWRKEWSSKPYLVGSVLVGWMVDFLGETKPWAVS